MEDHEVPSPAAGGSIRLPALASSASLAREFVRSQLLTAGHLELIDAALLCVSELVANAARHTDSAECVISVAGGEAMVRIEVLDESPGFPERTTAPADAEWGRGLSIVDSLSSEWGVSALHDHGKSVWLRLAAAHCPRGLSTR